MLLVLWVKEAVSDIPRDIGEVRTQVVPPSGKLPAMLLTAMLRIPRATFLTGTLVDDAADETSMRNARSLLYRHHEKVLKFESPKSIPEILIAQG